MLAGVMEKGVLGLLQDGLRPVEDGRVDYCSPGYRLPWKEKNKFCINFLNLRYASEALSDFLAVTP